VSTEKLVIAYQGEESALESAISRFGGKLTSRHRRIHIYVARFPTSDVQSLVRIRDALRAQGFDAAVTPTLPPVITG
jgi:hypothetical protein